MVMSFDSNNNDDAIVSEVRDALAQIDSTKIPDATITQAQERFVEPSINDQLGSNTVDQDQYDAAVIAWTAERAFDSWMSKTAMADAELQVEVDPEHYLKKLRERTNQALGIIDVQRKTTGTQKSRDYYNVTAAYSEDTVR